MMNEERNTAESLACPECGSALIKRRKTLKPPWRCEECTHSFEEPMRRASNVPRKVSRLIAESKD